jgi:hypothetical protein
MAMMHPALYADDGRESASVRLPLHGPLALRLKWPAICVIALAMGLAGCAREPAHRELSQQEVKAPRVHMASRARVHTEARLHTEPRLHTELRVHRPDPALLARQPAPNCEFKRTDVKAVDPDEWTRLKTEYERQCYRDAEMVARARLNELQASSICEVEHVPQKRTARQRAAGRD